MVVKREFDIEFRDVIVNAHRFNMGSIIKGTHVNKKIKLHFSKPTINN